MNPGEEETFLGCPCVQGRYIMRIMSPSPGMPLFAGRVPRPTGQKAAAKNALCSGVGCVGERTPAAHSSPTSPTWSPLVRKEQLNPSVPQTPHSWWVCGATWWPAITDPPRVQSGKGIGKAKAHPRQKVNGKTWAGARRFATGLIWRGFFTVSIEKSKKGRPKPIIVLSEQKRFLFINNL
jgi:hypothetical protein